MKDFQVFMGTVTFQNPLNIRQWFLYYPKADNISANGKWHPRKRKS